MNIALEKSPARSRYTKRAPFHHGKWRTGNGERAEADWHKPFAIAKTVPKKAGKLLASRDTIVSHVRFRNSS